MADKGKVIGWRVESDGITVFDGLRGCLVAGVSRTSGSPPPSGFLSVMEKK